MRVSGLLFICVLVGMSLCGTAQAITVFQDNFDVSQNTTDINYEYNNSARQSGNVGFFSYEEYSGFKPGGRYEWVTQLTERTVGTGDRFLNLRAVDHDYYEGDCAQYVWAGINHSFTEASDIDIDFDFAIALPGSDPYVSDQWVSITFGCNNTGTAHVPGQDWWGTAASVGSGLLITPTEWAMYEDGNYQTPVGSGTLSGIGGAWHHAKIRIESDAWGSPATVTVLLNGLQLMSYVRQSGFANNFMTLGSHGITPADGSGFAENGFDNLAISAPNVRTITGTVRVNTTGNPPLPGATVSTLDGSLSATTLLDGTYTLIVPDSFTGDLEIKASAAYVLPQQAVVVGASGTQDFLLDPNPARQCDALVTSYYGNAIRRFDAVTGEFVNVFATLPLADFIAIAPDGNVLVSTHDGSGRIEKFNIYSGGSMGTFGETQGNTYEPRQMAFGPDGNLYVACKTGSQIRKFDGTTGAYLGDVTPVTYANGLAFSPSGDAFYVGAWTVPGVYRFGYPGLDSTSTDFDGGPEGVCVGADGSVYVATWSNGVYKLQADLSNPQRLVALGAGSEVTSVRSAFGGNLAVTRGDNKVALYDSDNGAFLKTLFDANNPHDVAFLSAAQQISTIKGKVTANTPGNPAMVGMTVETVGGAYSATTNSEGAFIMIVPGGTYSVQVVAVGYGIIPQSVSVSEGGSARADFNLSPLGGIVNGDVRVNVPGSPLLPGATVALSDDTFLTTTDANGHYSVVLPEGNNAIKVSTPYVLAAQATVVVPPVGSSISHDFMVDPDPVRQRDMLVTNIWDGKIKRFDTLTGTLVGDFAKDLNNPQYMAVGPDGKVYVTSSSNILRIDQYSGYNYGAFATDLSEPHQLAFGPDGNIYVACQAAWAVKVLDGSTGGFLSDLMVEAPRGVGFSLNGDLYAAGWGLATNIFQLTAPDYYPETFGMIDGGPNGLCVSQDGTVYFSSASAGVYSSTADLSNVQTLVPGTSSDMFLSVDIGPGGCLYASAAAGNQVRIYNRTTGALIKSINTNAPYDVAILPAATQLSLVSGQVTQVVDNGPVAGAVVRTTDGSASAVTGEDGRYVLGVTPGIYTVEVVAPGFDTAQAPLTATTPQSFVIDFQLTTSAATYGSIASILSLSDGTSVNVDVAKVVTLGTGSSGDDSCYVEDEDRVAGIKLIGVPLSVVGEGITFVGTLGTIPTTGERYVSVGVISGRASGEPIAPLGMTNKSIVASAGPRTTGLYVKTWGRVIAKGSGYFTIDDGSGTGLKVIYGPQPPDDAFVSVVGVCSLASVEGVTRPVVRASQVLWPNPRIATSTIGSSKQIWLRASDCVSQSMVGGAPDFAASASAAASGNTLSGGAFYFYRPEASGTADQLDWWVEYEIPQSAMPVGFTLNGTWYFWARVSQQASDSADSDWLLVHGDPNDVPASNSNPSDSDWLAAALAGGTGKTVLNSLSSSSYTGNNFGWLSQTGTTVVAKAFTVVDGRARFRIYEREAGPNNAQIDMICWASDPDFRPSDTDVLSVAGW